MITIETITNKERYRNIYNLYSKKDIAMIFNINVNELMELTKQGLKHTVITAKKKKEYYFRLGVVRSFLDKKNRSC